MMAVMKRSNTKQSSSNRKEVTHARIVETAARAIRRSGYDGTGVADIMKEAGLTHGGFTHISHHVMQCSPRQQVKPAKILLR